MKILTLSELVQVSGGQSEFTYKTKISTEGISSACIAKIVELTPLVSNKSISEEQGLAQLFSICKTGELDLLEDKQDNSLIYDIHLI